MKRKGEARNVLLCAVLTAQLILLPVLGANVRAAGVTPDPNAAANKRPSMETAPNGVPVVNITAANGSGLSHNQYHDFNVHQQGLILNNSSGAANSQLGGIVAGNPNFHGNRGAEARTILNEVTSANRSRIEGYIEVNGRAADVILANPNGVTVNGGGFINVPRATITTGKPEVDPGGALRGYEVRQGDIRIEGAGINADNTDAFTLLARTAHVEAQVRASSLAVVTGKNSVAADGTVTPLADPSPAPADPGNPAAEEKPEVGIDSSALGGMYANRITLIATEKGVGVNLEGTVQSADQMVITADGKLRLREAVSGDDAVLAGKGDIELTGAAVTAARDLTVTADNLRLEKGVFEPQYEARKAKKQAGSVTAGAEAAPASGLSGPTPEPEPEKSSGLYAGGNLSIKANTLVLGEDAQAASGVDSSGGLTKDGNTTIAAGTVEAKRAKVLSGGSITIAAATANAASSTIAGRGDVVLSGGELALLNTLVQGGRVGLDLEHVKLTEKSKAEAVTDLAFRVAQAELNDASLSAGSDLLLDVGKALFDVQSSLSSGNDLTLRGTDVTLNGAFLAAGQDLEYSGESLSNMSGVLYAARDQRLYTSGLLLNDGGEIYAGRDILIADADGKGENAVRNLSGTISAGNELSISAKTVENKKREFEVAERGKHISYNEWYECNKPLLGHGCDRRQLWYYVNVYEDYILKDSPSAQMLAGGDILISADLLENHYSTIAAGNNLAVKATNVDNKDAVLQRTRTVRETMKGWDSDDDFTGEYFRSYNETYEEIGRSPVVLSAKSGLYMDVADTFNNYSDRQGISLPNGNSESAGYPFAGSPMFRPSTSPGHRYLIETNPMFTNMGLFYGSDYFLSRIGLDQDRQQVVLLGDAFYETRLVQQQILAATGQRFLNGYSSDADQMRGLMDAAAAQAQGLDLSVGVALTPTQVAALTQDIIWLEEEEHMGRKVLVPHLYLASATQQDIAPGGVQAKNVYINAGKSLLNEGLISGENVNLASVSIENTGGLLRGGSLNLTALNDIANNSGFIQGGDISLKAGGDIVSQTLTRPDAGNAAHQHVLAQGGIEATGTVTAVAGNDLAIRGSTLSAGGDVTLAAGRDMTVGTVTEEFHLDGGSRSWEHRVTHTGSTVAAGGNLNMTAGRDMTVAGSQVGAGGDAQLAAGGNLSVVAVQDTFSSFVKAESGKGGLFSSSSKSTYTQDYRTSKSSTVASGGNLSLLAGVTGLTPGASAASGAPASTGHASVVGSNLASGKDLTVAASGNVNVASAQNSSYFSHTKSTVGALGLSSSSKKEEKSSVTQVGSTLSGENVKISAGNDITATASNIFASRNVQLNAEKGNILLDAAQNTQSSYYKSSSSRAGIFGGSSGISFASSKQKQKGDGVSKNIGSAIMAGEDITMSAQHDVTSVGSLISAGNNVQIQSGRDVNLLPGNDTSYAFESSKKSEVGIGAALSSSGASLSLGYQSTAKGSKQNAAQNAGSLVQAGNDISITAGRDINQIASHMEAARDVNLNIGRDWNMLAGQDSQSASAWRKDVQAGITLSLQQNVSSAVQAVADLPQAMGSGQGGLGYQGVTAASAGLKAVTSVYNSIFQVVSASLSVGGSTSRQKSSSSSSTASPSTLLAGRDLEAVSGRDITIEGGRVQAGHDMALGAGRDLNIVAATNTYDSKQSASSASGGVNVSVGFGSSGMTVSGSVSASASGSQGKSSGTSYTNALVAAGNHLETTSGRDTNVKGAQVQGNTVDMAVGRDLNVHSLQDTAQSSGNSWSLGGSIGFDATGLVPDKIMGIPVTGSNGSGLNIGGGTSSGSMAWVNGQTSITAKEDLDIYTEKNTDIKGAVIAADNGNLTLNTGTLTHSNLHDSNRSESISGGLGVGGLMNNLVTSLDYSKTDQEQINRATVGDGLIITRDGSVDSLTSLNRDTGLAQEMTQDDKIRMGIYFDSNLADGSTWKTAWTGVNTLAGLSYGLLGSIFGDVQTEYKDGALQFTGHPFGIDGDGVTLGHAIMYFGSAKETDVWKYYNSPDQIVLGLHELGHIPQQEALGPLYIPTYLIMGGWWTNSNPFEQGANSSARERMKALGIYEKIQNGWRYE